MVVVHRAHGFRFVIDTLDHEPAHVHITGAGQAKINLLGPNGDPELVWSAGIKRSDGVACLLKSTSAARRC